MKKRIILAALLSLVLILSAFGGCTQSKLRAYSVYLQNDEIWTKYKSTYTPPREASVTFNGVTYTGTFSRTDPSPSSPSAYSYIGDDFTFDIDENGRLRKLSLDHQENKTCTFDEACWRKAADELADDYISLDNHQVKYVIMESPHLHEYRYERNLGSDRSVSDIIIRMNCSGEICYFYHTIDFENVKSVDVDQNKVQRAINKYMIKTYWNEFTRWEIGATEMTKTSSNHCAVLCNVLAYYIGVCGYEHFDVIKGITVIVDHEKYDSFKP